VAGFQAINGRIEKQRRIAVVLSDPVPGELLLAEVVIIFRKIVDDVPCKQCEIARRHHLVRIGPAGRVGESRIGEAEFPGALGHGGGEFRLRALQRFRDGDAGIVARLHDDALNENFDGNARADLGEHGRGARGLAARSQCMLADRKSRP